jgi:hypothetical protein
MALIQCEVAASAGNLPKAPHLAAAGSIAADPGSLKASIQGF